MNKRPSCLLPDDVAPIQYNVYLALQPNFSFAGTVETTLHVRRPTHKVVMHASNLNNLREVNLCAIDGIWTRKLAEEPHIDTQSQVLTLNFGSPIPFGLAKLRMKYSGAVNDQLCGIYQSTYVDKHGFKRYLATTQCEPTDARKIFPCFDEPLWKAILQLAVDIPASLTAVSNMPVANTEVLPYGFKRVRFEPTPPMSTYLFALLIGELDEEKWAWGRTKDGVLVRIITVPGKEKFGKFALLRAIRTLNFFTDYYQFPYPLPKCDLAAVPDFGVGAMENWGLDLFREPNLLADPKNSSRAQLERIELVVDHELGHQWHGDLVTMPWWDGIALNEAFATWTELLVARNLDPQKGAEEKFVAEDFSQALDEDAYTTTRPVFVPVEHPDQIDEVFDAITYSKGGSCIRMLEYFVSPEKFRNAMRIYIPRHAYGLATQENLWAAVEEVSGVEVVRMADAWFNQPGYPILFPERIADTNSYLVSQKRFSYERGKAPDEKTLWMVPMRVRTGDDTEAVRNHTLEGDSMEIHDLPRNKWIVWNADATGFYRVHYTTDDLMILREALGEGSISNACERIAILDDIFALTKAGYYNSSTLLGFYKALRNERHLRVWQVALANLTDVASLFYQEAFAPRMDEFVRDLVIDRANELGWEERQDDDYQSKILRGIILAALGAAGHEMTILEARERFTRAFRNLQTLNPDLRGAVCKTIATHGGEEEYGKLLSLYGKVELQEEKNRIFASLASFRQPDLLRRALEMLFSEEVRKQDIYLYLRPLGANPLASKMTWEFTKEHWREFCNTYENAKLLGNVITAVCDGLSSAEDEEDARSFFEKSPVPDAKRTIAQALEGIRIRARLYKREREVLAKYFSAEPASLILTTEALPAAPHSQTVS